MSALSISFLPNTLLRSLSTVSRFVQALNSDHVMFCNPYLLLIEQTLKTTIKLSCWDKFLWMAFFLFLDFPLFVNEKQLET